MIDLNGLVLDLTRMLQRLIGEDIHLVTRLAADVEAIKADPGQIEQVILNLAVNARDAMPGGGQVTIATAAVRLETGSLPEGSPRRAGRYALLAVSDNGDGIEQSVLSHIFEPFFTTKAEGKGTGLGLATVYGIVKQSGGHIQVETAVGVGTTFKIYLPIHDGSSAERVGTSAVGETGAGDVAGTETILVVEDQEMVRALACQILRRQGYRVLEAEDGIEAVALCRQNPDTIDLVVTDVVLPHMSGRQMVAEVLRWQPRLKVLYMSGYTEEAIVRSGLEGQSAFLQKPFSPDMLAQKVHEVLAN